MRYRDCMIAWEPTTGPLVGRRGMGTKPGEVQVGPHPDRNGWSDRYAMTIGGCTLAFKKATAMRAAFQCMLDFNTLVVCHGIDPQKAHQEFLKIDEYRFHISANAPGAATQPDWYEELLERENAWRHASDNEGASI